MKKAENIVMDHSSRFSEEKRFELSKELFEILGSILNEVHDFNYSSRFWAMMLQDHVRAVITRRDKLIDVESERKPDIFPINGPNYPSFKIKSKNYLIEFIKHLQTRFKKNQLWELLSKHNNVKFGFSGIQAAEDDGIGVSIPEYFYLFIGPGERSKRELIYKISDRFEDMFLKNCIRELPMYLVEYLKSAHDQIKLFEPDRKTIHVHIGRSVFMRLLVSKYAESGSKVIWYQHGSEMGEIEAPSGHYVQLSYCDEYRTWGWSTNEKEVPWKAYRLDGFKSTYQDYRHNKVNFDFLLCYPNLSDENRSRYTTITKTILYNLDSKYDRILARPRRSNKIHSHASELNFIKDRRVEKSTGLTHIADDISKCRLVIQMNVPSTNFLECVYSDIPTMGILNNPNPTEIINPFYDYFLTVGVLHDNFKALVQHLNDIEIEDWWQAIIKSTYYKEFKSCFTRNVNYPFNNEE